MCPLSSWESLSQCRQISKPFFCGERGHYASSCWNNPNRVHLVQGQHQRFDRINQSLTFLQNIFVYTTFNDNNHNTDSVYGLSSKTSPQPAQSAMASSLLILIHLSATWSTRVPAGDPGNMSTALGSPLRHRLRVISRAHDLRSGDPAAPLMPEFNFQQQMATT